MTPEIIQRLKEAARVLEAPTDATTNQKNLYFLLGFIAGLPEPRAKKEKAKAK